MSNYTKKEIEKMRAEIFDNIYSAGIYNGVDEMEAQDAAQDFTMNLTDEQVIKEYKDIT